MNLVSLLFSFSQHGRRRRRDQEDRGEDPASIISQWSLDFRILSEKDVYVRERAPKRFWLFVSV